MWKAKIGQVVRLIDTPGNLHIECFGHQGRVTRIQKQRLHTGLPGDSGWLYSVFCFKCAKHRTGLKSNHIMKVIRRIETPHRPYSSEQVPMHPSWYSRDERLRRGLE